VSGAQARPPRAGSGATAPRTAASNFFRALLQVPGWESMPPTLAAHLVQRNADPYFYATYWNCALQVVGALDGYPTLACR